MKKIRLFLTILTLFVFAGCATVMFNSSSTHYDRGTSQDCGTEDNSSDNQDQSSGETHEDNATTGYATYYGEGFHGKRTASGETFNMYALTAAHRTLPFGTLVRVTNIENFKSIVVRINDRGPVDESIIIDLSYESARRIDLLSKGMVKIEILR
ncbi:septal ring lytic transglycosylase RlpA family protein [candidate division WOR-3 bacterium]|nr:septal ring lytic transglycosylase RlpA family protein [candidate division WOR-3 bacterium]